MKYSEKALNTGARREFRIFLYLVLLALAVTLTVEAFNHKAFTDGPAALLRYMTRSPMAFLTNAAILLAVLAPAMFLRRRLFWCGVVSIIWLAGGAVNGFILINRMTPFTVADLTVFNTGLDTLPNYLSKPYLILLGAGVVLAAVSLGLLFWKGPRNRRSGRQRLLAGLAAVLVSGGALAGSWALAFQLDQLSMVFSNLAFAYEDYGFSYCFFQTWLNRGIRRPAGYDAGEVARIRELIAKDAQEAEPQEDVNVVIVQLESFIDPKEIQGLVMSKDPVPNWTALKENYSSGYLTMPVVGAGTANSECEVLTGMSTRLFGPGEYPYQTCLMDGTVESVAYDLKEHGYTTHAIHNHQAAFYSRNKVYANLGFDDFTALEYMPKVSVTMKNWAKDRILTSQIEKALNATADEPDLVFTVTVQSHGKYPREQTLENPAVRVLTCPDAEYRYALEYYVDQVRQVDQFIGKLTEMLSRRQERTILVLYGDHLPALGLQGKDMASGSLYKTEYVIWDNFDLKREDNNLYAYQLSAAALGRIGITNGVMNEFQQFCREEPSYRRDLKLLQYDVLYGKNYLYGGKTPYQPTELRMGMEPITITGLWEKDGAWYVGGENFSPYCQVVRDGDRLETEYLSPYLLRLTEDPETTEAGELEIQVVDKHNKVLSETGTE